MAFRYLNYYTATSLYYFSKVRTSVIQASKFVGVAVTCDQTTACVGHVEVNPAKNLGRNLVRQPWQMLCCYTTRFNFISHHLHDYKILQQSPPSLPFPSLHAPTLVWRRSYVSSITISRTDREGLLIYRQTCVIISLHGYESYFLFQLPEMMRFLFMRSCHCLYPSQDFDFDCEATQTLAGFRLKFLVVQLN